VDSVEWKVRDATREDVPVLADLIKQLAVYEKMLDDCVATDELYLKYGFSEDAIFSAILAENTGSEGPPYYGMALYYYTYSTFTGRPTLYLEDLFVLEEYRSRGIGTSMLKQLAQTALDKDCARMEWTCLDWNEPSIKYYLSLGAKPMDDWTVYRLTTKELKRLVENSR
jgi:N-acetylglutamate synthase-like GNAT family acetyltransferase